MKQALWFSYLRKFLKIVMVEKRQKQLLLVVVRGTLDIYYYFVLNTKIT